MKFYVGLHQPNHASHFDRSMVSINRLAGRISDFPAKEWMLDSGAFTEVTKHGGFRMSVERYAGLIGRWNRCGNLVAAVSQDYMCEDFVLKITGLSVDMHQRMTVDRYVRLLCCRPAAYILPVLQGYRPQEYVDHVVMYGDLLQHEQWVGVGSVCKRNSNASSVAAVLRAIKSRRPDLRLHGFGLKITSLETRK